MSLKSVLGELSAAVQAKAGIAGPLKIVDMTAAVSNFKQGANITIEHGYINAQGMFQALDLSGDVPSDSGAPQRIAELVLYKTGYNEPDYSAGGNSEGIKIYECASINSDYHAVAIDGQDWDLDTSAGGSNPGAFGVYYPVDLSVNPLQREYKRKDGAYKLSVIDEPDDETMARIAITRISDGVIICSTAPISKNDAIWDVWTGDYWGSMYQGTSVDEFDAEFPYYDARFISYGSGNFLTLSGAGVAAANGVYGRTDGSMDYESAGCAGAWVSEDGKAKLVLSFDWLWDDENDTELPCIYLRCEGKEVYNLPMPDIGWDYEIRSAADLEGYAWTVADDGTAPAPVVADTPAPEPTWSGYEMVWQEGSVTTEQNLVGVEGYLYMYTGEYVNDEELVLKCTCKGVFTKHSDVLYTCTDFEITANAGAYDPDTMSEYVIKKWSIELMHMAADEDCGTEEGDYWVIYTNDYRPDTLGSACFFGSSAATPADVTDWCDTPFGDFSAGGGEFPEFEMQEVTAGSPAGWYTAESLTEKLTIKGYTPEVGKFYSADTTLQVSVAANNH